MAKAEQRQEFRAVLDGLDLPDEAVLRINRSIQKAVASEIADLDLRGDLRSFLPWGRTWGIWYGRDLTEQVPPEFMP